jgi:hypothetical protein
LVFLKRGISWLTRSQRTAKSGVEDGWIAFVLADDYGDLTREYRCMRDET